MAQAFSFLEMVVAELCLRESVWMDGRNWRRKEPCPALGAERTNRPSLRMAFSGIYFDQQHTKRGPALKTFGKGGKVGASTDDDDVDVL